MSDFEYSEEAWGESAGHRPLAGIDVNQVFLLHRHWIWANYQRQLFRERLPDAPRPDEGAFMADGAWACMYLWYALLWSVIEGFDERQVDIRGPMREDIARVSEPLRHCRNVVFHVSSKDQHDPRLFELMHNPDSAYVISRISTGFGRMFLEEIAAHKAAGDFD